MKLIGMLLSLLLVTNPHPTVSLIDTGLKNPMSHTDDFTLEHYTKKKFPIYSTDIKAVAEISEKVAKMIWQTTDFSFDTVMANRSCIIINTEMEYNYKVITVRAVTVIEEQHMSFDFELVKRESDIRKAQKRLLDFSGYLLK